MEERNIIGFKNAHPDREFPEYERLSDDDTYEIRKKLKKIYEIPADEDRLELTKILFSLSKSTVEQNADDESFSLLGAFSRCQINPQNKVYINFYRFDEIFEMSLKDVSEYFQFLWYPHSDDIDIFDSSLAWILSITHDGEVKLLRKNQEDGFN